MEEFQSTSILRSSNPEDLVWSIAHIPSGCVLRVVGVSTEVVKEWLREKLRFLETIVGVDAYSKAFV